MTHCQCEQCAPGNPGKTSTAAFRLECEVRAVLSWPIDARRDYLRQVEARRGLMARTFLEGALRDEHARRRHG